MKILFATNNGYLSEFSAGVQSSTDYLVRKSRKLGHELSVFLALFGSGLFGLAAPRQAEAWLLPPSLATWSSAILSSGPRTPPRPWPKSSVFDYIEMFYNPRRKHVRNGMLSPVEFERQQEMKAEGV